MTRASFNVSFKCDNDLFSAYSVLLFQQFGYAGLKKVTGYRMHSQLAQLRFQKFFWQNQNNNIGLNY